MSEQDDAAVISGRWMSGGGVPEGTLGVILVPSAGGELRHMSYDDPPGDLTPEEFRALLAQAVRDAPSREVFIEMMVFSMATDLIMNHGVAAEHAEQAANEFSARVWDDLHQPGDQPG